ncbi:MAG: DUF58 domain-containing protein [Planctomycetes bacterium]|nr:DUF58 domain-containing protein [Planctomycetota bacterium]MDP6410083.1 DUF58 domain-containing protein [Planctomycetota bacterium]
MVKPKAPQERSPSLLAPDLMARVEQIRIRTHKLVNTALSGGYRSTFRGTGLEFEEVRPYQPGDDVRSIDWNVTARTGLPFIKTFSEERELTIDLLVDTSRSMDFGSRRWTKREAAAQLCALISFVAMRHQDRVGLTLFGERPGLHLDARKGSRHCLRVIREVLAAEPTDGPGDLRAALEHHLRAHRRRGLLFIVSDFLDASTANPDAGEPDWADTLESLGLRHDVICVRVVDPLEEDLPSAGLLPLAEIESGRWMELDTRSMRVRESWSEQAARRRARIEALLARVRVDLVEIDSAGDIADPLVAFFRRRVQRHGGRAF